MSEIMQNSVVRPAGRISERDGALELVLEMPGVPKDGVDISVEGDVLTVTGHRDEPSDETYIIRERPHGEFSATYTLDERVDAEKIDALMSDGVLLLTLHLRDEVKPKKIAIKSK
jgi:HSP20 family protein